jgi:hypothetical protein
MVSMIDSAEMTLLCGIVTSREVSICFAHLSSWSSALTLLFVTCAAHEQRLVGNRSALSIAGHRCR